MASRPGITGNIKGVAAELAPIETGIIGPQVEKIIVTQSNHPRAADPDEIAKAVRERGLPVDVQKNVGDALATAVGLARASSVGEPSDPVVLVIGSLFLVAEARQFFGLAPNLAEEE